jgi:protein-S-isoprenylcysteine O-methyltransferase Ste14
VDAGTHRHERGHRGRSRLAAIAGSALFLLAAPGVVVGVVPWLLTGWDGTGPPWPLQLVGAVLVAAGVGVLLHAFASFALEGRGTPAPVAPTEFVVTGGVYGWVRNPMYLAVLGAIAGQALLLGRAVLWVHGAVVAVAFVSFVHWYEEPVLARAHGERYEAYRRAVPGWIPRRPRSR